MKILLDESRPISERIKDIREKGIETTTKFLGVAIYTPILFIAYPEKYPVINQPVSEALDELGLYDIKKWNNEDEWISIPEMQEIVRAIAKKSELDFWQTNWLWWKISRGNGLGVLDDPLLEYVKKIHLVFLRILCMVLLSFYHGCKFHSIYEKYNVRIDLKIGSTIEHNTHK